MYRFRFGTIFELLNQAKIRGGGRLGSKTALYHAIVSGDKDSSPVDSSDISRLYKKGCKNYVPTGPVRNNVNRLSVETLAAHYNSELLPYLNENMHEALFFAIREVMKSDASIPDNHVFVMDEFTKSSIGKAEEIDLPKLLACLVKDRIQKDNQPDGEEDIVPGGFVEGFKTPLGIDGHVKITYGETPAESPLAPSAEGDGFGRVFEELFPGSYRLDISNANRFKVYVLDMYGRNGFSTQKLRRYIEENVGYYVYSRKEVKRREDAKKLTTLSLRAIQALKAKAKEGIGMNEAFSQMMTYFFMEGAMHAPKIYSAYELAEGGNIRKVSGVYFLPKGSAGVKENQIVFGAADVKDSLEEAVGNALSIAAEIGREPEKIRGHLTQSVMMGKGYDEETAAFLKSVIMPDRSKDVSEPTYSFTAFISYSVDVSGIDTWNADEYKRLVRERIDGEMKGAIPAISRMIAERGLDGYPFYFFVLPLDSAEKQSSELMADILEMKPE